MILLYRCDRASCPCIEQPVCSEGEKLQVVNPSQCCVQYKCVCDTSTCPLSIDECAFGYKLKVNRCFFSFVKYNARSKNLSIKSL